MERHRVRRLWRRRRNPLEFNFIKSRTSRPNNVDDILEQIKELQPNETVLEGMSAEALEKIAQKLNELSVMEGSKCLENLDQRLAEVVASSSTVADQLNVLGQQLHSISLNVTTVHQIISILKKLRNICAEGPPYQNAIVENQTILPDSFQLFETLILEKPSKEYQQCLRMGLQFISNLLVQNPVTQRFMWRVYSFPIKKYLRCDDDKIKEACSAMILNLYLSKKIGLVDIADSFEVLIDMLEKESTHEFPYYLFERIILDRDFFTTHYPNLMPRTRVAVLELIKDCLHKDEFKYIPIEIILFVCENFKNNTDNVLEAFADSSATIEPTELTMSLDILACVTANSEGIYLKELQKDRVLLVNVVFLLKSVHALSKIPTSYFASVNIEEISSPETSSVEMHPAYQFKSYLVRLVGNLCWRCRQSQDLVYEMEGIPLVLDCCNLDARNPLITQWAIFAIYNLSEGNRKVQNLIKSLQDKSGRCFSMAGIPPAQQPE